VVQPPSASRAAKRTFSQAISLTRLILHDLKATLEAERSAVELEHLRQKLTDAASGGKAPRDCEASSALSSRRREGTLIQEPVAGGQRASADPNRLTSSLTAALGPASSEGGSGLAESHPHPLNGNHRQQLVRRMLDYIHQHYSHHIELHDLAAAMNLNASYVSSLFSTAHDVTFHHYLEGFRLDRAKDLLCDPVKRVSEVAYAVGYSNPNHFRNVFTSRVGLCPSAWRRTQAS
jgi:AraC-like DNA-binding protein